MKLKAPEGWHTTTIGQEADLLTGFPFPSSGYSADGVRLVRGSNVKRGVLDWGEPITEYWPRVNGDISRYQLREGDLVVAMDGALVGRSFAAIDKNDVPSLLVQRVARLRSEKMQQGLMVAWIGSRAFESHVDSLKTQTAIPHISPADIRAFPVAVPNEPEEQAAIASALSDIDVLLCSLDVLIAKKRDIKQAAMQQLLTSKTRLPGFEGKWKVRLLGDVADVKTGPFGSSLHERDYVLDGTPIITVEHLGERGVDHVNVPMVSDVDRKRLSAYSLEIGDIVFSRVGSIDRNALIRVAEVGWLFSGRLLRVRPRMDIIDPTFLSYQFHSERFRADVRSVAVGQTMASLNTKILNGLVVYLPTLAEQTAIAEVLSDMDAELAALEARRDKTRLLKQGMMQELLTGKTRLV
jgi:type I restriction enzyme S subunit